MAWRPEHDPAIGVWMDVISTSPRRPLYEVSARALAGSPGAALELARRSPCATLTQFLARHVPGGVLTPALFDLLADAFADTRAERRREVLAAARFAVRPPAPSS